MSNSFFNKCNSSAGAGGAVYCVNCGKVSITTSVFFHCACTKACTSCGGLLIEEALSLPAISHTDFISCSAAQDGGGFYIYGSTGGINGENVPVSNCRFVNCIAIGNIGQTYHDSDGGGLVFWQIDHTIGISNSLIVKCQSAARAGGSFIAIHNIYFDNIIRFCFYSGNTAEKGRNALIHFNNPSSDLWSIVFYHSFTSDASLTNSLIQNYPDASEVTDNWLPQGSIYFVYSTRCPSKARGNTQFCIYSGTTELLKIISAAFSVQASQPRHNSLSHLLILPSLDV